MGQFASGGFTERTVLEALKQVVDPEIGLNIVDMGLVYSVRITPRVLEVDLTMTSPSCPMGEMIVDDAQDVLRELVPESTDIVVNLVWDPPWSSSRMSEKARSTLGW